MYYYVVKCRIRTSDFHRPRFVRIYSAPGNGAKENDMKLKSYDSWKDFAQDEFKLYGTFQLSIDELARDIYFDETKEDFEEPEELKFD
jgi:hypothetical protein